jgi:hypothetical protein
MEATDHEMAGKIRYVGRCRKGTMSVMMTCIKGMQPPPPIPCIERPIRSCVKFGDRQQTIVPTVNKSNDKSKNNCRPKTSEILTTNGWITAQESRYEEPTQKVSVAVPWREAAIIYVTRIRT